MKITIRLLVIILLALCNNMNAQEIKLEGSDAIIARQKLTCGTTEEGKIRYGMWEGRGYSRIPGEKDKHLFNVIGINVRQCLVVEDEIRGKGYKSVSREIMMYLDPSSNEIIDKWLNPFTGKEVEVIHVANDPVNMHGISFEKNEDGEYGNPVKLRQYGDLTWSSAEIPLFYSNPLGGEYQAYVGGAYHAMEIFNSVYKSQEILSSEVKTIGHSNISWSRVAQWLPWMEMGSKPGIMVFNATGFSTFNKSEIWPALQEVLDERYPLYNVPPPIDDKRANETSWTVFEKFMEGKEKTKVGRH